MDFLYTLIHCKLEHHYRLRTTRKAATAKLGNAKLGTELHEKIEHLDSEEDAAKKLKQASFFLPPCRCCRLLTFDVYLDPLHYMLIGGLCL